MAFTIRRPLEITLDPKPREREDRRQRSRLAEEMRRFKELADKAATRRNRQLLADERKRERLPAVREAFAPPRTFEVPTREQEEERLEAGGEIGRGFRRSIERGADPEKLKRIDRVLQEEGVSQSQFNALVSGQAALFSPEDLEKTTRAVNRLMGTPDPPLEEELQRILKSDMPLEEKRQFFDAFRQAALARQERAPALGLIEAPFAAAGLGAEKIAEAAGGGERVQLGANIGAQLGAGVLGAKVIPTSVLSRLPGGVRTAANVAAVAGTAEPRRVPRVPTGVVGRTVPELAEEAGPAVRRLAPDDVADLRRDIAAELELAEATGDAERIARLQAEAGYLDAVTGAEPEAIVPLLRDELQGIERELRRREIPFGGRAGMSPAQARREARTGRGLTQPSAEGATSELTARHEALTDLLPELERRTGVVAEVPAQVVDDFEAIPREAIEASARQQPAPIGGAGEQFTTPLRPFEDVAREVVTRDDPIAQALARVGVNPSLLETSNVGRATVAFARQRGSSEQIINVTLASAVDSHRAGIGGRLPIAIGDDAIATLNSGKRVPWNDLFSTNRFDNELNTAQRAFVDDYRRVVDEVEFLRTQAGLKPRAVKGKEAAEGWFYIPRQVRGIRGMELRRPANPGLQRHYEEAIEGIKNGIKYESDPRAVLELHLRQSYREIAEKQMSDFLEPLSITPKELVPEGIRKRMNAAVTERLSAERARRQLTVSRALGEVEPETARRLRGRSVRRPAPEKGFRFEPGKMTALQRQADIRLGAARKQYAAAKNMYGRALESARKAELAPGNLFGKAEDVIPVGQWRNRFFPLEDAERLNDALGAFLQSPKRANWVGRGFEQLGNHIRFLSAVGDFAAPFIQGLPLLGRNPVAWSRATWRHYQAFADPTIQAKFIREHIDTFQEMAQHNVPIGDVEFFKAIQEGQGISVGALIERLPKGTQARNLLRGVGKQTFGRFQASYDMFLSSARAQLWESMKPAWRGSLDELATHVRNMTGGLDSKALGVGPTQRGFESTWLAFSPRLLRSTVALIGDLRLGLRNPRGQAAYRALGGLTAGTVGMYIAAGMAMGKSEEEIRRGLNPLEGKKFLSYNINGDWVGVGGQVRAITQLLARSAANPESLLAPGQFDNPLLQFAASRGAPGLRIVQTIGEAATGADLLPFDDIDSLPDMFLHIGQSALPFAVQGLLEGEGAGTFVAGLAGARTSPETRFETLKNARQAAMDERGIPGSFDELRLNQPDVALEIEREPRVVEAQRVLDEQPARTQAGEGFQRLEETRTEFRGRQQQDDDNLREFFQSGGQTEFTPQIYGDNARERARELANRRDQIRQDFELEFADRVPDPGTVGAAIEGYFAVDIEDFTDPLTGAIDWGPFNDAQDRALSGLSDQQREGAMSVIRKNQTDIQRAFRELRDEPDMDEYWDIPPEDRQVRENFRSRNPRVDAILFVTGTTTKLMGTRGLEAANGLVRRLFGSRASVSREALREQRGRGGNGILPGGGRSILPGAGGSILPGGGRSILP